MAEAQTAPDGTTVDNALNLMAASYAPAFAGNGFERGAECGRAIANGQPQA
jgi:hypothetical protein